MFLNISSAQVVNPLEGVKSIVLNETPMPHTDKLRKILNSTAEENVSVIKHRDQYKVAYKREALDINATFKFFDVKRGVFSFKVDKYHGHIVEAKIHFKIEDEVMYCW